MCHLKMGNSAVLRTEPSGGVGRLWTNELVPAVDLPAVLIPLVDGEGPSPRDAEPPAVGGCVQGCSAMVLPLTATPARLRGSRAVATAGGPEPLARCGQTPPREEPEPSRMPVRDSIR